ncbi:hypothetical protein EZS27_010703 [termite gut metagenome]|uniref:Uncharacterized protein n=1 Tax=termite gut metagenome TaxID=433724 RepID=A0A5J4S875_9ZZZZ
MGLCDITIWFFELFRARVVKVNYNQVFHALIRNFGEQKTRFMMKILEESTREFALSKLEIEGFLPQKFKMKKRKNL